MQDAHKDTQSKDMHVNVMETHHQNMENVEALTNELKRLLVRHENTLQEEGIKHEVETLERWMESYRRGLAAAGKISETGKEWLVNLRNHLKLAAEEMHRLESEGGNPGGNDQVEKTEELLKAVRKIDKVIPDIEQMFSKSQEEDA